MRNKRTLAMIGMGPRGSYALENLISTLVDHQEAPDVQLLLFEATGNFGNGQVYDTQQTNDNWLNVSERALELQGRKSLIYKGIELPGFPSYHQWADFDQGKASTDIDVYPPRAKLGVYLQERCQSLIEPLAAN
ncbi:MAG: FAD/NAD(P)-binding protein, partial [Saprospiraceae bacterium]|nr:FAD/NAD(P)-binding protein [Saprospiraceae bacterium]